MSPLFLATEVNTCFQMWKREILSQNIIIVRILPQEMKGFQAEVTQPPLRKAVIQKVEALNLCESHFRQLLLWEGLIF